MIILVLKNSLWIFKIMKIINLINLTLIIFLPNLFNINIKNRMMILSNPKNNRKWILILYLLTDLN